MHSCPKSSVFESHRRNKVWLFQECIFLGAESLDDVHYVTEASSSAWPTRILLYPRRWLSTKWMIFSLSSAASSFSVDSKWRELSCRADYERDRFLLLSILPWSGASLLTVAFGCFSSRLKDHQQGFSLYESLLAHLDWLDGHPAIQTLFVMDHTQYLRMLEPSAVCPHASFISRADLVGSGWAHQT